MTTMGNIVFFVLMWALCLLLLLAVYKLCFSGTTLHRFNRIYLLASCVLSAVVPFVRLNLPQTQSLAIQNTAFAQTLQAVTVYGGDHRLAAVPENAEFLWAWLLIGCWTVYVTVLVTGWTRSIVKTRRFLKGKKVRRIGGRRIGRHGNDRLRLGQIRVVLHDEAFGPFSWMNYIVISKSENGFARRASLRHEVSHIRLCHGADLAFLLACTIVNPVCWLIMKEIKIVHEYEADDEVINRYGIEEKDYQRLLIMRTVGAEAYALASSFHSNIKKRIAMMKKVKTMKKRTLGLLAVIPAFMLMSLVCGNNVCAAERQNAGTANENVVKIIIDNRVSYVYPQSEKESLPVVVEDLEELGKIVRKNKVASAVVLVGEDPDNRMADVREILRDNRCLKVTVGKLEREEAFTAVENMPKFPGGNKAMTEYMINSLKYPAEAAKNGIEGRVLVSFVIEKDGSISECKILKSSDNELLDQEALRVISAMPAWTPGTQNGKTVRVNNVIPVIFRLAE